MEAHVGIGVMQILDHTLGPLEGLLAEGLPAVKRHYCAQVLQLCSELSGYLSYVLCTANADLVGVLVVQQHVGQQGNHIHGEGAALGGITDGQGQQRGKLREQGDGGFIGGTVGAALKGEKRKTSVNLKTLMGI